LGVHFYTASRLIPIFLGGFLLVQALFAWLLGRRGRPVVSSTHPPLLTRAFGPLVGLYAVAALVFAPLGLYFLRTPGSLTQRASAVSLANPEISGGDPLGRFMQAAAANPALELQEMDLCPACGDPLLPGGVCLRCSRGEDLAGAAARDLLEADDEDIDPMSRVADQMGLGEHILAELAAVLDPEDLPIADFLIGELDERGFMQTPLDVVAASLDVPVERVEKVLAALQSVGPVGLGARDVRECLRLQLDRWSELGVASPLAREIVEGHLEDLGHGRYAQIAHSLGATTGEVVAARDFIRAHLRPYPVAEEADLAPWQRERGPGLITPDVVVRLDPKGQIEVEVPESRRYALSIGAEYRRYADLIEAGAPTTSLSSEERKHVATHVQEARQFIGHIRERRATMKRVATYVMARQEAFLRGGPRHLAPLTRAEVADALGLHESTVSRATAGKFVLLNSRQVVPFATFFKVALSVHDVLREIIAAEDHPLTDDELSEQLAARGYQVARRTVAKYRNEMGILPSSLR
jgi:RNA polymerase sigma-54 factor